ncbi:MAG TPA: amidohydrolase family protein [Pseudonocardiaceae bacterium]|jgi:L-fuconolactonase|nr:amidohydrolase family protein [Pseudonocardiaceae bacterium]
MTDSVVDAHHHLWDLATRDYPWLAGEAMTPIRRRYDAADLRERTDKAGVSGTVLVQTTSDLTETTEFLATAAAEPDLIRGVVGWVNLTDPAIADTLAELRTRPGGERLVGIRHQVQDEPDPEWLTRPDVRRGLRAIANAGLAYDLLLSPGQLPAAIKTVQALPEARFILDHAGKPRIATGETQSWSDLLGTLAELPNVACKLSGLVTEADWKHWSPADLRPYALRVLFAFGPDRVMFGSDWPVCELATGYQEVFALAGDLCGELSTAERNAVFGNTARAWYDL